MQVFPIYLFGIRSRSPGLCWFCTDSCSETWLQDHGKGFTAVMGQWSVWVETLLTLQTLGCVRTT